MMGLRVLGKRAVYSAHFRYRATPSANLRAVLNKLPRGMRMTKMKSHGTALRPLLGPKQGMQSSKLSESPKLYVVEGAHIGTSL